MNKKLKVIIGIIAILILIFVITKIVKNNSSTEESEETKVSDIKYDEETGEYYILDEETGEILHTANSEGDLYIYTIDPDYDPQNPDAVSSDEIYDEELEKN